MCLKKLQFLLLLFLLGCTNSMTPVLNIPTTTPVSTVAGSCPEVSSGFPQGKKLPGKLVLDRHAQYGLLDLADSTFVEIPPFVSFVSPDGEKVAGYSWNESIYVKDVEGAILRVFPWDKKWTEANSALFSGVMGYETHLVSFQWWDKDTLTIASLPAGSQFRLNVNTGEINEIVFPYGNELYNFGTSSDNRSGFVLFSPPFDHVVYTLSGFTFAVRELGGDQNPILWAQNIGYAPANPVWSPDGQLLAVAIGDEIDNIHLIDTIGQDSTITDLNKLFNNPYQAHIYQMDWSPDGRKIAFSIEVKQAEETNSNRLLVLDLNSRQIVDYCTPDPNTPYYDAGGFTFMWSPDGRYIATETTLIDLDERKVYRIPDVLIDDWVGVGKMQ